MRKAIGTALWSAGPVIGLLALAAAFVYIVACVVWLHAPVPDVLRVTATMLLLPLGLAWSCRIIGSRLRTDAVPAVRPRWLKAVIGIAVAAACVALGRSGLNFYACSVNRSPGHVCDGDLARFDISFQPLARATRDLAFQPVDLTQTPFARFESLGGRAERLMNVPSILYRGFRLPDGHVLTLSEHDMSADGSSTWRDPRDEPERINGLPARLTVLEAPSGSVVSHLSWVEGRRDYGLWVDANVTRAPLRPLRKQLFALAELLPRSVPACPHEPPPKQFKFDKDGRRIQEPPPASLTVEQAEAMFDRRRRPCK